MGEEPKNATFALGNVAIDWQPFRETTATSSKPALNVNSIQAAPIDLSYHARQKGDHFCKRRFSVLRQGAVAAYARPFCRAVQQHKALGGGRKLVYTLLSGSDLLPCVQEIMSEEITVPL